MYLAPSANLVTVNMQLFSHPLHLVFDVADLKSSRQSAGVTKETCLSSKFSREFMAQP